MKRVLCHRYVGSMEAAPAIVEIDEKSSAEPRVRQFDGMEPSSTIFFNGIIIWDADNEKLVWKLM